MRAHQEEWDALTPDERAHHVCLGEAYLAELDDELTS
jgi:hypothetical protein